MLYYLMQWIIFERLEPYAVKIASTVLRREGRSNLSDLSDHVQIERKARRTWQAPNISSVSVR